MQQYEELLRIKQVSERLNIAKSTIWLWVKNNRFPKPMKAGRCTFWKMSDIQRWIAESQEVVNAEK